MAPCSCCPPRGQTLEEVAGQGLGASRFDAGIRDRALAGVWYSEEGTREELEEMLDRARDSPPGTVLDVPTPDYSIGTKAHAVDLALSLAAWKMQGSTIPRVVALLEPGPRISLSFELLYVIFSRVPSTADYRCPPPSPQPLTGTSSALRGPTSLSSSG